METKRMQLVLDLDETLIHSKIIQPGTEGFDFTFYSCNTDFGVFKRPGLEVFLKCASRWFDLIIWTAGQKEYAQDILRNIIPDGVIVHLLSNKDCSYVKMQTKEFPVKDLSKIPQYEEDKTFIVDDRPTSFIFQPCNGLQIPTFTGAKDDRYLFWLLVYLYVIQQQGHCRVLEKEIWPKIAKSCFHLVEKALYEECTDEERTQLKTLVPNE